MSDEPFDQMPEILNGPQVDVVVLTKYGGPLRQDVASALRMLRGVDVRLHRVIGAPRSSDRDP